MTTLPDKNAVITACENILTRGPNLSEGFRSLLQTTISALKGDETPEIQKAINTWHSILREKNLPSTMNKYAIAASMYLEKLKH